ncbi:hypothetical protein [Spongiibacter tropicus]|uniref:hypothetical protein n=1 Tax=Spongiibacter tropicus TaxID=454602 RepID=UPI0003B60166|nr:hypothetical protein [Spongiibacter tropicus]
MTQAEQRPPAPQAIHRLVEHLVATPHDRQLLKSGPESLFERFDIPKAQREALLRSDRDELYALGVHPNFVIKWLIWSGRPTMAFFPISYYFDRR